MREGRVFDLLSGHGTVIMSTGPVAFMPKSLNLAVFSKDSFLFVDIRC